MAQNPNSALASTSTKKIEAKMPCPLLDDLPVEVRLEILGHLVGRHTYKEHDMKSAEYDRNRRSILGGGDHTYQLYPAILGVNKLLREEALSVFLEENALIRLTSRQWGYHELCYPGFSVLATADDARSFSSALMSLDFDGAYSIEDLRSCWCPSRRETVLFSFKDLPKVCAMIARKAYEIRSPSLIIKMGDHVRGSSNIGKGMIPKVLASLQDLRGLADVRIQGLEDLQLVNTIIAAMCRRRRSTAELMQAIAHCLGQAEEASRKGNHRQAITEHRTALNIIRGSYLDQDESAQVLVGGRFDGMLAGQASNDTEIKLHTLIATSYLELDERRMARVYVERVCDPLYGFDDRANTVNFPLQDGEMKGSPAVYVELLGVAAKISWSHGKMHEALDELHEAQRLNPDDLKIEKQLEQYEAYTNEHFARKNQRRN